VVLLSTAWGNLKHASKRRYRNGRATCSRRTYCFL
jgi:hypothetical protein